MGGMLKMGGLLKFLAPLDRKLMRDLWRVKGQATAIAVVIGIGVQLMVMTQGSVTTLEETKRAYYERYRLAEIFAPLKRAPDHILKRLAEIPGVAAVEGRANGGVTVNLPGVGLPIKSLALSIPLSGTPRLNDIYLVEGRRLNAANKDEIILLEGFAIAHDLEIGDQLSATMNGARRSFDIVGFAQSPEFTFVTPVGEMMPDDARFTVIWMNEEALDAAFDLDGAFNEALFALSPNANVPAVMRAVDDMLAAYGGTGSYQLKDQASNFMITQEIEGMRGMSQSVPPIFLAVAAFLLYIVTTRMVQAEREQIGLMKAFGYSGIEVGLHYFKFVLIIAMGGAVLGAGLGILSGNGIAMMYQAFFKFPFLVFQVDYGGFMVGLLVSIAAASAGGLFVMREVFNLNPAVAMRPPAPADYSKSRGFGPVMKRLLDQQSRMILRRLSRQPGRMAAAVVGIAGGMALSVGMTSMMSSFEHTIDKTFSVQDRSDLTVTFIEPLSDKTAYELGRIPGILQVEPFRYVSAILRNGTRTHRGTINGLVALPELNRALNEKDQSIHIRDDGIILADNLAEKLGLTAADHLTVEVQEGRRPIITMPVVGISESMMGSPAYLELGALNRALKDGARVSGAYLRIDQAHAENIYKTLKDMPGVAGVTRSKDAQDAFQRQMDEGAGMMRYVMSVMAAIITFGIVFNSARVAFAERMRDLASLRVMGFTRGEAGFVLLGELAVITLLALPLGSLFGYFIAEAMATAFSTEMYQISNHMVSSTFGVAAVAVLVAAIFSGWLVKRDIDRIDLVESLKIRE